MCISLDPRVVMIAVALTCMICSGPPAFSQDASLQDQPPRDQASQPATPAPAPPQAPTDTSLLNEHGEVDPMRVLLRELGELRSELLLTRRELAQARLEAAQAKRELEEMRQFIADHEQYGRDFEQYRAVREAAEREARQRQSEAARERQRIEASHRAARQAAARSFRARRDAEAELVQQYRRAGFTPLGLDVYASKMAYHYPAESTTTYDIEYDTAIGDFLEPIGPYTRVDYTRMTISGSILNAAEITRDIGVAITFFDENGAQVGGEIMQINNARPDVPYPFTATLDMALNRPFDTSSIYVLYADPAETSASPQPTTMPPPTAAPPQQPNSTDAPAPQQ